MSLEWFCRGGGPAALCLAIETALLSPVVLGLLAAALSVDLHTRPAALSGRRE